MTTLLVTGGLGFIGSNFIRHIINKYDYKIINLDKVTYSANFENLEDVEKNANYKFVRGDICDANVVDSVIKNNKIDMIVNFAAESHVDRSIMYAGDFVKTDIFGTYILLEAVKKFKINRFVQVSSDEVYGSIEDGSFLEHSSLNPNSPYSASKAGADLLVRSYFITFKLPVIITRSSNNFGPYQHPEKLIPLFITNLLEDKKVPLYGNGLNIRDWIYVLDNCEAIDLILHKGERGEIYNIGANNEKTNLEITKFILRELNKPESFITFVKDRKGHDKRYSLDCTKIRKLGWKAVYKFEESLRHTIKWYMHHNRWWKAIKQGEFKKYYIEQYET